jgi:2-oxo-3-hexenedioate decarboxylase
VPTSSSVDAEEELASRILNARASKNAIAPITKTEPNFDLAGAYAVSARVAERRFSGGARRVGWKIGFTNESTWKDFGVTAPIWGPMYDTTVSEVDPKGSACAIGPMLEPRIEPEIALRIGRIPEIRMDEADLLSCIDAVAHGFEIVQSVYPGWSGKAPDCVAAFGMHGCYRHGPFVPIDPAERVRWMTMLSEFSVVLFRDGTEMERGVGRNVLGGPLSALKHFVRGMTAYPGYALRAGDIVTTGTLTRALSIAPGERWSTRVEGIPLPGLVLSLV